MAAKSASGFAELVGEEVLRVGHVHRGAELLDDEEGLLLRVVEQHGDAVVALDRLPAELPAVLGVEDAHGADEVGVFQGNGLKAGNLEWHVTILLSIP